MKKYNIWKTNGSNYELCCQIEAKNEISALRKNAAGLLSSGEKWIDKENRTLNTSYGAEFMALEEK